MIAQLNRDYIRANPSKVFPRLLSYFFYEGRAATTRGRWFNPVTFISLQFAAKSKAVSLAESPVFITGTGRSGSTMLGLVLSMHPDAGFLNEPKALWYYANPKDDLIGSYSTGAAEYIMKAPQGIPVIADKVKSIYSSFLNISGTRRIIDKFPEMIFRVEYLNELFKNPKYIFLYRDPWETISSTAIWSKKHADTEKKENWWGVSERKWKLLISQVVPFDTVLSHHTSLISSLTSESDKAAVEWIVTMNFGMEMLLKFPGQVLPVKYESLCLNPEKILREICVFTGLPENKSLFDFGKQVIHSAPSKARPELHPILFDAVCDLSLKLGYEVQSPSMSVTE